jgi:hypothetical protein
MDQLTDQAQQLFMKMLGRYNEDTYFYLVRNYLGVVTTPFHKPQLTAKLCQFFSQKTHQDRMLELLDELDLVILSLLAVTGPLPSEGVMDLLKGSYSYGTVLRRVANLQERLVLLTDEGKLVFNPLLAEELASRCSLRPLFGEHGQQVSTAPYCSTEFLRAYLSLVAKESKAVFREEYLKVFPSFELQPLQQMFTALTQVLTQNLILTGEKKVSIDYDRARMLLQLNDHQLICLLLCSQMNTFRGESSFAFCSDLLSYLNALAQIDTTSLKLLIRSLSLKHGIAYDSEVLTHLSTWGVITLDGVWKVADIELEQQSNALLIDSDQTISYLGNRLMDDILYRFTFIEVLDRQKRYRLTKESFLRGLDSGLSYREIEQYLQENSSTAMHSLLLKQLGMLNERYQAITVYDALLLSCDERTAHVVQNLPALAEHRYKSISPTLFLMRRDTEETWRQILASAGLLAGATRSYEKIEVLKQKEPVSLSLLVQQALRCHRCTTLKVDGDKIQMITDESLQREIESSPFTQAQKQDLLHRFHAKMILSSSQVVAQAINTTIEAGGFDYQGKVSLVRQAVGRKDVALQLQLTDQELVVQALEVAYTVEREALLKAAVMPTMEVKILPISKIFLIQLVRFHVS